MTATTTRSLQPARTASPARTGLLRRLTTWHAVWQQRRALAEMDETRLADIGLTPETARRESRRPVWDVPVHWLK